MINLPPYFPKSKQHRACMPTAYPATPLARPWKITRRETPTKKITPQTPHGATTTTARHNTLTNPPPPPTTLKVALYFTCSLPSAKKLFPPRSRHPHTFRVPPAAPTSARHLLHLRGPTAQPGTPQSTPSPSTNRPQLFSPSTYRRHRRHG